MRGEFTVASGMASLALEDQGASVQCLGPYPTAAWSSFGYSVQGTTVLLGIASDSCAGSTGSGSDTTLGNFVHQ
jgi:hypothetical protein